VGNPKVLARPREANGEGSAVTGRRAKQTVPGFLSDLNAQREDLAGRPSTSDAPYCCIS
jgi:hypothetical protein